MAEITVFLARTVRTMEASLPVAEAVAVAGWPHSRGRDARDVTSVAGFPQPRD